MKLEEARHTLYVQNLAVSRHEKISPPSKKIIIFKLGIMVKEAREIVSRILYYLKSIISIRHKTIERLDPAIILIYSLSIFLSKTPINITGNDGKCCI